MSLPYYGGMRHIHVTPGSFDQACGEIRKLSDSEVRRVMDFISKLRAQRKPVDRPVGSPRLIARHAGRFTFNEGELMELLTTVLRAREVGLK